MAAFVLPGVLMPHPPILPPSSDDAEAASMPPSPSVADLYSKMEHSFKGAVDSGTAALKAFVVAGEGSKNSENIRVTLPAISRALASAIASAAAANEKQNRDICVLALWCRAMAEVMSPFSSVPTRRVSALAAVALTDMAPSPTIVAEMRRHNAGLLTAVAVPPRRPLAGALTPQKGRIRATNNNQGVDEVFLAVASVMDVFLSNASAQSETETAIETAFAELLAISPAGQRVWATFPLERRVELCCQLLQSTVAALSAAAFDRFVLPAVVVPLAAIVDFGSAGPQAALVSPSLARRVEFLFRTPRISSSLAAGDHNSLRCKIRELLLRSMPPSSSLAVSSSEHDASQEAKHHPDPVPPRRDRPAVVTINFLLRCRFPFGVIHTILCYAYVIVPVPPHQLLRRRGATAAAAKARCGHRWCDLKAQRTVVCCGWQSPRGSWQSPLRRFWPQGRR